MKSSISSLQAFQKHQITVELCDNDFDTSIVKAALAATAAKEDSVKVSEPSGWLLCCYSPILVTISYYFQVQP